MTEILEPVAAEARASAEESEGEDMARTQVIGRSYAPVEKKTPPKPGAKPGRDEDVLGDLRKVINKKFDELLQG